MKAQVVCAVVLLALCGSALAAQAKSKRNDQPARWINMTVDTVAHENSHPSDSHLDSFPSVYTFCVPLAHRPVGPKYVVAVTYMFNGVVDELVVDYMCNGNPIDYVHKDRITDGKLTVMLHDFDGNDLNGWTEEGFSKHIAGAVYAKGADVTVVKFSVLGFFEDAPELTCEHHHHQHPMDQTEEGETLEQPLDTPYINIEITPLYPGGMSRAALRSIIIVVCGFLAVMVFACCCCHINTHAEEYDELSRMEEQLQTSDIAYAHPVVVEDEDAILRRVQEESLREYNARNAAAPQYHPEQQQYMRVPVMSPELYAQYLRAAQAQQ